MINNLKMLMAKVDKLEREIENISNETSKFANNSFCEVRKNLLNFSCIDKTRFELKQIDVIKNEKILFETTLETNCSAVQDVEISLIVDGFSISKTTRSLIAGINVFGLSQSYVPLKSGKAKIEIEVCPADERQIILSNVSLYIWGIKSDESAIKYDAINFGNKLLISFCKNNMIYYKIITKNSQSFNESEFNYFASGIDYSFVYDEFLDSIFVYRIDSENNLWLLNLSSQKTIFIDSNVRGVSALFHNEKHYISYIKNGKCFIAEFANNILYNSSVVECNFVAEKCSLFFNNLSQKFHLILTTQKNKNYLFSSSKISKSCGENLTANYRIYADCYEVENES